MSTTERSAGVAKASRSDASTALCTARGVAREEGPCGGGFEPTSTPPQGARIISTTAHTGRNDSARRQSYNSANGGNKAPAAMPPTGVAHCLSENTKGCHAGAVTRDSTKEPVGFIGPVPMPIRAAPANANSGCAAISAKQPKAENAMSHWKVRVGPKRWITVCEPSPVSIASR